MQDSDFEKEAQPVWHVPMTTQEFPPLPTADIMWEVRRLFEEAYNAELSAYYRSMSGEDPSLTGDPTGDEWKMIFRAMDFATEQGTYGRLLAELTPKQLLLKMRFAFRHRTRLKIALIKKQGMQRLIEDKHRREAANDAAKDASQDAAE